MRITITSDNFFVSDDISSFSSSEVAASLPSKRNKLPSLLFDRIIKLLLSADCSIICKASCLAFSNRRPADPSAIILYELSTKNVIVPESEDCLASFLSSGPARANTINKMASILSISTTICLSFCCLRVVMVIFFNLLISLKYIFLCFLKLNK